ncbi:hypothetical protein ACQP1W_02425 [Spirillospora sp. CA-255316]
MRKTIAAGVVVALMGAGLVPDRPSRTDTCQQEEAAYVRLLHATSLGDSLPVPSSALSCAPGRPKPAP